MTEYLRSILNAFHDLIFIFNDDGVITDYLTPNQRSELIAPREAFLNKNYKNVLPSNVVEEMDLAFEKIRDGASSAEFDYTIVNNSEKHWYSAVISVVDEGKTPRYLGVVRNITKRKKAEEKIKQTNEELQKVNKQKDKIFSVIAHDLKNAVTGPLGLYELIFSDYESLSKEELFEYLKMLQKSAINQSDLLNDLLMWSRNQFKNSSVSPERVHLAEIVNTVLKHTETAATEKNISIENHIEDEIYIYADPDMLKTILRNLVNNAIKFSHPGGSVRLDAQRKKNKVSVSVSDDGVGMSDDAIKKIFNKDIHYTTSGTKGEKGSGLGLDLCVDFMEKHNGLIEAKSKPGEGTTITFTLPEQESGKE